MIELSPEFLARAAALLSSIREIHRTIVSQGKHPCELASAAQSSIQALTAAEQVLRKILEENH